MEGKLSTAGNPITEKSQVLERNSTKCSDTTKLSYGNHETPDATEPAANDVPTMGEHLTSPSHQEESGASSPSDDESSEDGGQSGDEDEEEDEEENEEELTDENVLKNAGVDVDVISTLAVIPSGGVAPLNLLSEVYYARASDHPAHGCHVCCVAQFVSCCIRNEYRAAFILCKKVLEYEPGNETAKEFLPVIQERLKLGECNHISAKVSDLAVGCCCLDEELSTESSSDYDTDESNSSAEDNPADRESNIPTTTTYHHDCM